MGEPISLALVGGAVLTEGVKFLFDQASYLAAPHVVALYRAAKARGEV